MFLFSKAFLNVIRFPMNPTVVLPIILQLQPLLCKLELKGEHGVAGSTFWSGVDGVRCYPEVKVFS